MNATSLYVSTSRLVFQNESEHNQNWTDLYTLIPYLRQSLSCAVCSNLLMEPYTPSKLNCQHHVCKQCIRRRRNMKPLCPFCKDCDIYNENMQLRILLQCYKRLCEHILTIPMYNIIKRQNHGDLSITRGKSIVNSSLVDFIEEGATFRDSFKCNSGLKRSDYSILPCVFARTDVKVPISEEPLIDDLNKQNCGIAKPESTQPVNLRHPPIKTVSNGSAMYSVLYTGIGNKITIKRKVESDEESNAKELQTAANTKTIAKRRGCRCGNAAITPGKLTCCGQRCPCYVESKSCLNCKCRGCRNPHRPDGGKVRPHIPELACYEIQVADENTSSPITVATSPNDYLQIPLQNYNPSNRFVREVPIVKSAHQQACSIIDNMARESYIVTEGSIEAVNVFTSQTRPQHNQVEQDTAHSRNNQTSRPQIVMEAKETSNIIVHQDDLSQHNASIFMSPDSTPTITLSPIIVTTSKSVPCQFFSEDKIMTSCPPPSPTRNPTLVDFVLTSNEPNIFN